MPPISRSARRLTVALGGLALCMSAAGLTSAQDGVPSPQIQQGQQSTPTLPAGAPDAAAQQQELEQALEGLDEAANKIDGMEESELAQNRPNIEASLQRLELALIQGSSAGPARFTAARDAIDAARASLRSDDADRKDLAATLRKVTAAVKDARAQATAPGTPGAQQVATPPAAPPEAQLRPLDVDQPQTTGALMQREGAGEVVARPPAEDRPVAAMGRKLIGMQVVGADKAYIGSVGDVVMDGDRARAVILRIGGFLGLGARRIAIPVERLRLDDNRLASTLNEQEARSLPAYEP